MHTSPAHADIGQGLRRRNPGRARGCRASMTPRTSAARPAWWRRRSFRTAAPRRAWRTSSRRMKGRRVECAAVCTLCVRLGNCSSAGEKGCGVLRWVCSCAVWAWCVQSPQNFFMSICTFLMAKLIKWKTNKRLNMVLLLHAGAHSALQSHNASAQQTTTMLIRYRNSASADSLGSACSKCSAQQQACRLERPSCPGPTIPAAQRLALQRCSLR